MTATRFWWALGFVLVGAAIVVCLVPLSLPPVAVDMSDKVSHMIGHGALALYFAGLVERRSWWKIFVFLLVFGIGIELAQHYMNVGRHGDVRDLYANSLGALLGLALAWLGLWRWPQLVSRVIGRGGAAS